MRAVFVIVMCLQIGALHLSSNPVHGLGLAPGADKCFIKAATEAVDLLKTDRLHKRFSSVIHMAFLHVIKLYSV